MKAKTLLTSAIALVLVLGFAPEAKAQVFEIGFGHNEHRHGRHGHRNTGVNVRFGFGRRREHRRHRRCEPVPRCEPVRRHVHHHSKACERWIPGQCRVVRERVWVPGCSRQEWVAPCYETRYDPCGNPVQVLVRPGHYITVTDPGRWEVRERTVQDPGRMTYICGH